MHSVIKVNLGQQSYEIEIKPFGLDQLGESMTDLVAAEKKKVLGKKVLVVSNPTIFSHYGKRAIAALKSADFEVAELILEEGESYKTLASIQKIYDAALKIPLERSSTMVALGGGVIGDMTGFAAATWLRGINFVQVPTTLLAMVDAAIGGKTGVNHPQGKNLIGAFHQPRLVLIDPEVLNTLPDREFRAGMAEVIKYGVILKAELFAKMEQCESLKQISDLDEGLLPEILKLSAEAKAGVVSTDERETGLREILNYGHTIGHAIESLTHYSLVNHGEAVAIGIAAAGQIAVALPLCEQWDQKTQERQLALIKKAGLDTKLPPEINIEDLIEALQTDKKVKDGRVRFVLPKRIGEAIVTDEVQPDQIRQVYFNS